jgi:FkbM family methyltransferase
VNPLRFLPDSWKEALRRRAGAVTPRARLENLHRAGFRPQRIIDAGAFQGDWARLAHAVFPKAPILLIEPQPQLATQLQQLCAQHPGWRTRAVLLGAYAGTAHFQLAETNSRIVAAPAIPAADKSVVPLPINTLARVATEEGFAECDFLKLDLQGHELEALKGAHDLFGKIEVIVTEVSWLRIGDVPLVSDVLAAFAERNYRPYDIWGFNYRPLDRALWQSDITFVRADSPLLANRNWS